MPSYQAPSRQASGNPRVGSRRACPHPSPSQEDAGPPSVHIPLCRPLGAAVQRQRQEGQGLQAEDQGPDSLRPKAESSHTPFSSEGRAVSARAGPQGTSCQCKSLRTPSGAGRKGALEGAEEGPGCTAPLPPMGTKKALKPQGLLQRRAPAFLIGASQPQSCSCRCPPCLPHAPPGHHRPPCSQRGV